MVMYASGTGTGSALFYAYNNQTHDAIPFIFDGVSYLI